MECSKEAEDKRQAGEYGVSTAENDLQITNVLKLCCVELKGNKLPLCVTWTWFRLMAGMHCCNFCEPKKPKKP